MDEFALKIAFANVLGFLISVGAPLYASPRLPSSIYGARENPWWWLILSMSFFVFLLTIILFDGRSKTRLRSFVNIDKNRYIFNFLISIFFPWASLPSFKPFPDPWVLSVPLTFAFIISSAVYLHNYDINFDYIKSESISEKAKLERIRMEYETWFRSFVAVLSGYTVIAITSAVSFPAITNLMVTNGAEHKFLFDIFIFSLVVNVLIFLTILCKEFISKINDIQIKVTDIPRDRSA